MRTILPSMLAGICLIATTSVSAQTDISALKKELHRDLGKQKGTFAVAFHDLSSGQHLLINAHETFHAASTMKTPVMVEAFKQAAEGKYSLSDSITIKNSFSSIVDGSSFSLDQAGDGDQEIYKWIGSKLPIRDLVYRMIILSSNLATNMVIEKVGAANVTETIRSFGAKEMKVLRGVEDGKAYQRGLNNTTTAHDLMLIFDKIASATAVNKEASEAMLDILLDQQFRDIIPSKLPANVRVAHKTGAISRVRHDSGIVMLPDGRRYVLVLLSKELEDENEAVKAMAGVSEKIYNFMTQKRV